jgi:two-component system sensor histidine kinase PilS (NtrC family)
VGAAPAAIGEDAGRWPAYWRSLAYFTLSRLVVAAILIAYVPVLRAVGSLDERLDATTFLGVAVAYLCVAIVFVAVSRPGRIAFAPLAAFQVAFDVVALSVLIHAAGGVRSGLAVLLILPNAGAAILLGARLALFFSAVSALALLGDTAWRALEGESGDAAFLQSGLVGAALLATAATVARLASRLSTQERLAWRRGEDLRNQLAVTQAVIADMPDGVVVLGPRGEPRAINRAARDMLSGGAPRGAMPGLPALRVALGVAPAADGVVSAADGVVSAADAVRAAAAADAGEFLVPAADGSPGRRVRARRLQAPSGGSDAVIVLEDLGRLEERAQQLKLASMGRLSASIAHEIRNPLSAIRHANGLLAESLDESRLQRLATIVEDNCRRIDRIVEDVLSISRRGSAAPERIAAEPFLSQVVAELVAQSGADPRRVACDVRASAPIWFDAGNLRQVLLNLLGNALRHASGERGAVTVEWSEDPSGRLVLVVADDGPGVPDVSRVHLFEPFFTTEARGTGLGLHLARELCTANGATIRYRPACDDPPLRSAFVVEPAPAPASDR